jgi:hypothetical protein
MEGIPAPAMCLWEPQAGAVAYQLQLASDQAFAAVVLSDSSLTDTIRLLPGVDTLATLFWRVRAKNAAGWGPFSDVRQFRIAAVLNVPVATDEGWQVVSVPVTVSDRRAVSVFPAAASALYAYDAGYIERDSLTAGAGYWVRFTSPGMLTISGRPLTSDTIDVRAGWNLIGSISVPVAAAAVQSLPPGILALPFYVFQGSYASADTLTPGKGYWVRCTAAGQIILQAPARR